MQDASAEFATAVAKGEVVWCDPLLLADWLSDGASTLAAGQPACVIDPFTNRDSSAGWGRPRVGGPAWANTGGVDADYDVPFAGAGYARIRFAAVNTGRLTLIQTASESMRVEAAWVASATLTGTGEATFDVFGRGSSDGNNYEGVRAEVAPSDNTIDLLLVQRSGGTTTAVATSNNALTYVAGHEYRMVIEVDATDQTLRAKAWDTDTETEPASWMLEYEIPSLNASGSTYAGFRSTMPSTITTTTPFYIHVSDFRVIDGSVDDLSDLAGLITVTQTLDDGLPDEVSFVQDQGTALLDAEIIDGRQGLDAQEYLSQFRTDSPLYGVARDVAPVTFEHGVVTSNGPERVRLFTGKMVDLPLGRDKVGHLTAMSQTRLMLTKPVQPPPFNRIGDLSATWPISWACYQCGVYAAPPPASGCIYYMPMHGSMQPFLDSYQPTAASMRGVFSIGTENFIRDGGGESVWQHITGGIDESTENDTPPYVYGPYVAAPALQFTSELALGLAVTPLFTSNTGDDYLSQAGPRGRLEFAVRADAFDATPPSGSQLAPDTFIVGLLLESISTGARVYCGINMSRQLRIEMDDGTVSVTFTCTFGALPTDGEWYKIGLAWDFAAEACYFYQRDPDGTEHEETQSSISLDVTRLPATDDAFATLDPFVGPVFLEPLSPWFHAFLPFAEMHFTSGTGANPGNAPWIWEDAYEWTQRAILRPSMIRLRAIAELTAREAWELIGSYAQSEMATMRIDEHDRLIYGPPSYWVEQDQLTEGQTLSTRTNVGDFAPQVDPSKVRNSISVTYREARLNGPFYTPVYSSREVLALPPGTSELIIPLDIPATEIDTALATLPSSAQVAAGVSNFTGISWHTFVTVNSADDGTGTYYTGPDSINDPVLIQALDVFEAGLVTLEIVNNTGTTVYTANTNPEVPTIMIGGIGLREFETSATVEREDSITRRGFRGLVVPSVVQRREDATRLAQRLIAELSTPVATLENVLLFGDQRRQPGDLVAFDDSAKQKISGSWRLLSVKHVINGGEYRQEGRLRQAWPVGEWQESGTSRWGSVRWGREGL